MKSKIIILALCFIGTIFSQKLPGPISITAPDFEKDKKGQNLVFDFTTKIKPFTHPNLSLESYKGKNLLFFYFACSTFVL